MSRYLGVPQGYWPLFQRISQEVSEKHSLLLAIDGRCGSGKTQLAQLLAQTFDCNVFHMDDFYLPFQDRTPERMSSPGGHIEFERLEAQILAPLSKGEPFTLYPFDCHQGRLGQGREIPPRPLTILEGSYSHHPALRPWHDLSVFLTCNPQVQESRLTLRQADKGGFSPFQIRWIPMEEGYFAHYKVEESSQLVLDTSDFFP